MPTTSQLAYEAVRNAAGAFERTDIAVAAVSGNDRFTWLQGMISNDTRQLGSRTVRRLPACILDATGHVLSIITLTASQDLAAPLMLEAPAEGMPALLQHLDNFLITEDVTLEAVPMRVCALQGPNAEALLEKLDWDLRTAATPADLTGSGGFSLVLEPEAADLFFATCASLGVPTIDPDVQELLRIEAGIPRYSNDVNKGIIALEALLGPTHISLGKGCYVGQEIIARIDSRGHTNRALTGFVVDPSATVTPGDKLFGDAEGGAELGWITSVAASSPAAQGASIALGYLRHEHRVTGTKLKTADGAGITVADLPFYRAAPSAD
jgi:folate-binding protein YgfZ